MSAQRAPRFGFNTHGNVIPVPKPGGRNVTIIAAMDVHDGIGKTNGIPWAISPDMQQFKRLTTDHPVVMGRKTFESLGSKPLPNRMNVVVSRDPDILDKVPKSIYLAIATSVEVAIQILHQEQVFIIGGAQIYREAFELDLVDDMILTRISHEAQCDTFFPAFKLGDWMDPVFSSHELSGGVTMRYEYWRRKKQE